jgi:nicotinate-nucleotide--dimethylbenzimidazole phosphoribosyltransferase
MSLNFDISPVDRSLTDELQQKIDDKTKPVGALGVLEHIALRTGLIQQRLHPVLSQPVLAVFAGDHGISSEGVVNAYPQEVTAQMVRNMINGGAAVNVLCNTHRILSKIIDAGVATDFEPDGKLIDRKIDYGTSNYMERPAMSRGQCLQAIEEGAKLVDQWNREGTNIIGFGDMGIGNTSSASVITSLITEKSIEECTGKGTGLDEKGVRKKAKILTEAMGKHQISDDPITVLKTFGGFEIAMIAGGMLRAAECQMIILVDGFIVTAALLIAHALYGEVLDYVIFAHESGERGHRIQLEYLGGDPVLQLNMRLGEGTGAAMAYPVVRSAVNIMNDMASFEDAGISRGGAE